MSAISAGVYTPWIDVKRYGADSSGSADASTAIQAAIDASPAGGVVYIPYGTYLLNTGLSINKQIGFIGAGHGSTVFMLGGNINGISFNVGQATPRNQLVIGNFGIGTSSDRASGAGLRIGNIGQSLIQNVLVSNAYGGRPYNGIEVLSGATQCKWDHVRAVGCANLGAYVFQDGGIGTIVDHWFNDHCKFEANLSSGLRVYNSTGTGTTNDIEGIYLGKLSSSGNGAVGVDLWVAASSVMKNIFLDGTILDGNTSYGLGQSGSGTIQVVRLDNVWASHNLSHNIVLDQTIDDFVIDGGHNSLADNVGILIYGAKNGRIQNQSIMSNGRDDIGDYGLHIDNNASNILVSNNKIYNNTSVYAGALMNGIFIAAGCADITVVSNWIAVGSGKTPLSDAGTRTREWGNITDQAVHSSMMADFVTAAKWGID
jgi:hypothetical protein